MLLCVALGSLASTGCLIAEAPSYDQPRRTVPVIDSVTPQPSHLLEIVSDATAQPFSQPFTFQVYSEDAGEPLVASLVVDYLTARQYVLTAIDLPARAADEPKNVALTFKPDPRVPDGCHSLTALVMHESSATAEGYPIKVSDRDVAEVTWWVFLDTGPDDPVDCPRRGQ
jgi:hypothetical protein